MDTKSLVSHDRQSRLKMALEANNKNEEDLRCDILEVREWFLRQPGVPEIPSDSIITNFILMNKFQLNQVKEKLDMYYKIRPMIRELFSNKHPRLPHMQKMANIMYNVPMPKATKEGYRVTVVQIQEYGSEKIEVYDFLAHAYNIAEVRLHEDIANGEVVVYDVARMKLDLIIQFTPDVIKKILLILEKVYSNRMKQINYINAPPVAQALITIVKTLLKPKLAKRLNVHPDLDSLYRLVPREILPKDYGGEESSLHELNELWKKKLAEYDDRFNFLEKLALSSQSISTSQNDSYGIQGSFRKLDID